MTLSIQQTKTLDYTATLCIDLLHLTNSEKQSRTPIAKLVGCVSSAVEIISQKPVEFGFPVPEGDNVGEGEQEGGRLRITIL
jgi:hypothetical protein